MGSLLILSLVTLLAINILFCDLCVLTKDEKIPESTLIITTYLENGESDFARNKSRVTPDLGNVTSYSGYFTVNKSCGNNLFFWFFPAETDWEKAPVILWLQGGPGSSSMYGLFELIGPFNSLPDGLKARNYSWTKLANVLFIDNPAGVGFSFSTKDCIPTSITTIAQELYSALTQFFKLFPMLQGNPLYLTGESFAGHYLPELGRIVHERNQSSNGDVIINMVGILIGNPLMKLDCHDYAGFLYQIGWADDDLRKEILKYQTELKNNVASKNYSGAFYNYDYILNTLIPPDQPSIFNFLTEPPDPSNYIDYLNSSVINDQIHVGNRQFVDQSWDIYYNLSMYTMAESFAPQVEQLLRTEKYTIVFYTGQLDILCMYTSAECIMRGLQWSGQQKYLSADRFIWHYKDPETKDDTMAGWVKYANSGCGWLLDILVKDSGHSVPYYKPAVSYLMIESILSAQPCTLPLRSLVLNPTLF